MTTHLLWICGHFTLNFSLLSVFQVPAGQKDTDLVGRPIVHKSAFKQATGNLQISQKQIPLVPSLLGTVFFV
jgi:hypothetical protein